MNIFLRQFRIPTSEVMAHLARGDSEPLGAEKLRGLRNVLPETEEVGARHLVSISDPRPRLCCHSNEFSCACTRIHVTDTCPGEI